MLRTLLFGGIPRSSSLLDLGLLPLRILAGLALTFEYGMRKLPPPDVFIERVGLWGFPFPPLFAWSATLTEVIGGLLLALGLLTRPVAFLILCTMAVVVFLAQAEGLFIDRLPGMLFGAIAILFLCIGSGGWGIDALIRGKGRYR